MDEVAYHTRGVNKPIGEMCALSIHVSTYKVQKSKCTHQVVDYARRGVITPTTKDAPPARVSTHKLRRNEYAHGVGRHAQGVNGCTVEELTMTIHASVCTQAAER